MIKSMLTGDLLAGLAAFGLLTFFAVFVTVLLWALTRRQHQITSWSALALEDGLLDDKSIVAESHPCPEPTSAPTGDLPIVDYEESRGCGKCENCTC